jgi:hypothetical protein
VSRISFKDIGHLWGNLKTHLLNNMENTSIPREKNILNITLSFFFSVF